MTVFFTTTKKEKKFFFVLFALLAIYGLYLAALIFSSPSVLRVAKVTTIENFFWSKPERFNEKLQKYFPPETNERVFYQSLEKVGFKIKKTSLHSNTNDTHYYATTHMPSGITPALSVATFDVVIIADFKSEKLVSIKGLLSIQTY